MDPERMLALAAAARRASARGVPMSEINQTIARASNGAFRDAQSLVRAMEGAGFTLQDVQGFNPEPETAEAQPPEPEPSKPFKPGAGDAVRIVLSGGTLGLSDELRGAAEAIGALIPGGRSPGEAFREGTEAERDRLRRVREARPLTSLAGEGLGGVVTGGAGVKAAGKILGAGKGLLSRVARAAGIGAAEAAAYGAGTGEGAGDRAKRAATGAAVGAVAGGAIPAVAAGGRAVGRGARRLRRAVGGDPLLGDAAEAGAELSGRLREGAEVAGEIRPTTEAAQARGRQAFKNLDAIEDIGEDVAAVLRNENVARLGSVPREIVEGQRPASFSESQKAFQRIRKGRDRALRNADADSFTRFSEAMESLGDAINEATEGAFAEANVGFREQQDIIRAAVQGRKLAGRAAEDVEAAFEAVATPEAREAFRQGVAASLVRRFDSAGPASFVRQAQSPQLRRKLEIIFDGQPREALESFIEDLASTEINGRRDFFRRILGQAGIGGAGGATLLGGAKLLGAF